MKRVIWTFLLLVTAAGAVQAEVSIQGDGSVRVLSPQGRTWTQVRQGIDPSLVLNPSGDRRGDGPPSIAVNPVTGEPEVVWARFTGSFDVVFSRYDGNRWTEPLVVSAGFPGNDLLPTLVHDCRGNRVVAWSRIEESAQVFLAVAPVRPDGTVLFTPPARFSRLTLPARSPSLVIGECRALVAFEEERSYGRYAVVVAADLSAFGGIGPRSGGPLVNPFQVGEQDCGASTPPAPKAYSPLPGHHPHLPPPPPVPPPQDPMDPASRSDVQLHEAEGTVWMDWTVDHQIGWVRVLENSLTEARYVEVVNGHVDAARREAAREAARQ